MVDTLSAQGWLRNQIGEVYASPATLFRHLNNEQARINRKGLNKLRALTDPRSDKQEYEERLKSFFEAYANLELDKACMNQTLDTYHDKTGTEPTPEDAGLLARTYILAEQYSKKGKAKKPEPGNRRRGGQSERQLQG
ncbi:MAG: hypothetical protein ACR2QC_07025 [Gammaproteobacteria bacterium]